ncbi:MAG TPA: adenosylcobinamide-phosphate synthase CbiB [Chloroflexota bacterium]|nr:adenosylcobinamide-phosphate synthase CbiB [Chloroflexota bacterium]
MRRREPRLEIGWSPDDTPARRAMVLLLAVLIDRIVGEPSAALHPVVWIGRLVSSLRDRAPRDHGAVQLAYGALVVGCAVGTAVVVAGIVDRMIGRLPLFASLVVGAVALKPTFAVRALDEAGEKVERALARGDKAEAREALRSLVSRDTTDLETPLLAAAAIESLAENSSDSAVAPWLFFLIAGLPGAYAYRAANTVDAMIGYRGAFEYLGKVGARLDDLLNIVPSRFTALLLVIGAAFNRADALQAVRVARRDARLTSSPNAGWPMSAMAGALGIRLEKVGHYVLDPTGSLPTAESVGRARGIVAAGLNVFLVGCTIAAFAISVVNRATKVADALIERAGNALMVDR